MNRPFAHYQYDSILYVSIPFCKSYFPDDGKMAHDIARERERTKNLSIRFHML